MLEHDVYHFYVIGYSGEKIACQRALWLLTNCQLAEARDYVNDLDSGNKIYLNYFSYTKLTEDIIPLALEYLLQFKIIPEHVIVHGVV